VNLGPGTQLSSIKGLTFTCACAGGSGLLETDSTTTGDGSYTMKGNVPCAAAPPIRPEAKTAVPTAKDIEANLDMVCSMGRRTGWPFYR